MALDCLCHKCNGVPENEDNFFEVCENEVSNLKLKSMEIEMKNESNTPLYFFLGFVFFLIISSIAWA